MSGYFDALRRAALGLPGQADPRSRSRFEDLFAPQEIGPSVTDDIEEDASMPVAARPRRHEAERARDADDPAGPNVVNTTGPPEIDVTVGRPVPPAVAAGTPEEWDSADAGAGFPLRKTDETADTGRDRHAHTDHAEVHEADLERPSSAAVPLVESAGTDSEATTGSENETGTVTALDEPPESAEPVTPRAEPTIERDPLAEDLYQRLTKSLRETLGAEVETATGDMVSSQLRNSDDASDPIPVIVEIGQVDIRLPHPTAPAIRSDRPRSHPDAPIALDAYLKRGRGP